MSCVILDNGAGKIKYGMEGSVGERPAGSMSNCTARVFKQMQFLVGDEVDEFVNGSMLQYTRPFDRGYLNNWQCEIDVWTRLFGPRKLDIANPGEHELLVTEPPFSPEPWQDDMNEVVYEYFGFASLLRRPAAWFSSYEFMNNAPLDTVNSRCCLVVDSGFSFSHALPFIESKCLKAACKRVNIGGKLLTNYLKEVVSYRQWNMMDEYKLMDQVKEELCYISTDFMGELSRSKHQQQGKSRWQSSNSMDIHGGNLRKYFVLPDFHSIMRGYVRDDNADTQQGEQVLTMDTERFSIPELLFNPSDVGLEMAGIAEASWQSLRQLGPVERSLCCGNVVLTGGNLNIPQFKQRFTAELRQDVPDIYPMQVYQPDYPEEFAWKGCNRFVHDLRRSGQFQDQFISKADYMEQGSSYCNAKFFSSW